MTWGGIVRLGGVLVALPLLIGNSMLPGDDDIAAASITDGFRVYHYASIVDGTSFREVFLVHAVASGFDAPTAAVDIRINGLPLAVQWSDGDGRVSVEDRFEFVQEAFDEKQVLTAHFGDRQVMQCLFGGGAGVSIHPNEWRAMGLPQEVRCLELTDDQ